MVIFKLMISNITQYSPHWKLITVFNPVDILTCIAWKLCEFPGNCVFGCGYNLDTACFHFLFGQNLVIHSESCHGWIPGKHVGSSVSVWSEHCWCPFEDSDLRYRN